MKTEAPKSQLHFSWLQTFMMCGIKYYRRHVLHEPLPSSVPILVGTSVHKSSEHDLKAKCVDGKLLEADVVTDKARDTIVKGWEEGVLLIGDERTSQKKTKGNAIDSAVRRAKKHHEVLAPKINPVTDQKLLSPYMELEEGVVGVEYKWTIGIKGRDYILAGQVDVIEATAIRDLKNPTKSPSKNTAFDSDQFTIYALERYVNTGKIPEKIYLDYTVDLVGGVKCGSIETTRSKADFKVLLNRIDACVKAIQAGVFCPTDQNNWWCDPRYCGYAPTCEYHRLKESM